MMHAPLTFKPNTKDYIWGGRRLADWGKDLPDEGQVAESWELSAHPNGMSVVADGTYAGQTFQALIDRFGERLIGTGLSERDRAKFPLLIKLIDAKKDLSIQVHPDDAYAHANENGEYGKNEMWIVLDAPEGAQLVAGMKDGVDRATFARAIEEDTVLECMNYIPVEAGDVVNIPAGLVHAITAGLVIYEVQQNSDTTYRVYDYNRPGADGKPRPLHVAKALDVIDWARRPEVKLPGQALGSGAGADGGLRTLLVANRYFAVERLTVDQTFDEQADGTRFYAYTVVGGSGTFRYTDADGAAASRPVTVGETLLVPASLGTYSWTADDGALTVIKSYIPDWDVLGAEIEAGGGSVEDLDGVVGVEPRP